MAINKQGGPFSISYSVDMEGEEDEDMEFGDDLAEVRARALEVIGLGRFNHATLWEMRNEEWEDVETLSGDDLQG